MLLWQKNVLAVQGAAGKRHYAEIMEVRKTTLTVWKEPVDILVTITIK